MAATGMSHWYAGNDGERRQEIVRGALRHTARAPQFVHGHAKGEACNDWCHEIPLPG